MEDWARRIDLLIIILLLLLSIARRRFTLFILFFAGRRRLLFFSRERHGCKTFCHTSTCDKGSILTVFLFLFLNISWGDHQYFSSRFISISGSIAQINMHLCVAMKEFLGIRPGIMTNCMKILSKYF